MKSLANLSAIILVVFTGHIYCKTFAWKSDTHSPAIANKVNHGSTEEDEKSPTHDPAIAVAKPHHYSSHHSEYHTPALANSLEHHSNLDTEDKSEMHTPAIATIVSHKIPDKSIAGGATIVTAYRNPSSKYPGMTLTSVSSYSDSNSSHIPAVAVSTTSANSPALAIFGKNPEMSLTITNPTRHKPLTLGFPVLGKGAGHETHTPAIANPSRPSSIWDNAHKYDSEATESTIVRIPLNLSAIKEYTKPVWSFFTKSIPKLSFGRSDDNQNKNEREEFIIPEDKIPQFANNINEKNETANNTKTMMKFEDVWHTNRQKWEIPLDEALLQSVEFNNFWKLYQQYLQQQMQSPQQQPSHSILSDTLPRPQKPDVVHIQSTNYVPKYTVCSEKENLHAVIKQDKFSCQHFFRCSFGNAMRFTCSEGTLFDTTLNLCNHADSVNCGDRP